MHQKGGCSQRFPWQLLKGLNRHAIGHTSLSLGEISDLSCRPSVRSSRQILADLGRCAPQSLRGVGSQGLRSLSDRPDSSTATLRVCIYDITHCSENLLTSRACIR